ncbi:MAG: hypothetical protein JNK02_13920 [Planctomycetes bacterium]|nr:hypothetical protein [Planctomycetota bacterium]
MAVPVHTASTLALFGLIWLVQIVHYPLMAQVGPAAFRRWHDRNLRLTTWVVGPFMLAEVASALLLLAAPPSHVAPWLPVLGALLVLAVWVSTAVLQVPMHRRLEAGWDPRAHRLLVRSNWLRTGLWTARAGVALAIAG